MRTGLEIVRNVQINVSPALEVEKIVVFPVKVLVKLVKGLKPIVFLV